jgi:hypothetical protein
MHSVPRTQGNLGLALHRASGIAAALHHVPFEHSLVERLCKAQDAAATRLHQDVLRLANTDLLQPALTELRIAAAGGHSEVSGLEHGGQSASDLTLCPDPACARCGYF